MKIKVTLLLFILFSCSAFAQCYTAAYTAYGTTIARRIDGTLWAKGFNFTGTAGTGNTVQQPNYIQIGTDNDWSENFCIGDTHALAIKNDGTLWVWGKDTNGCLGLGLSTLNTIVTPTQIGTDTDWAFVASDEKNSAAIKTNGTLWTWGDNQSGQLGIGSTVNFNQLTPIQAGNDTNWAKVFSNDATYFAIKTDGTLWAWGARGSGTGYKLGYLSTMPILDSKSPHLVNTANNWVSVAVGQNMAIALQANGTLWAWGDNSTGQFGNGTTNPTNTLVQTPMQLGSDSDWSQISMSHQSCVALKTNQTRWGWGTNGIHPVGNGTTNNIAFPTQIDNDTDWEFINIDSFGYIGGNGIKQNNSLLIWGYDISIAASHLTPTQEGSICTLANENFTSNTGIKVYPNPIMGKADIQYELKNNMLVRLDISNMLGQIISSEQFRGYPGINHQSIDMNDYASGIYWITVKTNSGSRQFKLIKN